ncbi:MAG: copper resistance D family protein, partial [Sciscionella sp.]
PGVVQPATGVQVGLLVARVTFDLSAVLTVGLSLLPMLVGVDRLAAAERILAATRPVAVASAALWSVAALVSLVLQAADYDPADTLSAGAVLAYVGRVGSGQALVIVAGLALLHALLGVATVRRGESVPAGLRGALALFTLLPLPVTGHAADTAGGLHDVALVSMELHVLGAVAWSGGLLAVIGAVAASRSLLSTTLPRFSTLATVSLLLVGVTGLVNGWLELYLTPGVHWYTALFTTGYGQVLIGKMLCFSALAALGGSIRFRLLPLIARHQRTGLVAWATVELAVMGLAFGFAVVLTRAPVITS